MRQPKAAEIVAQEMLPDFVAAALGPGDRLAQESEMIARYGVARSTLREALRILEVNGLVTMRSGPRGGPLLRRAEAADFGRMASLFLQAARVPLSEVLEARRILEPALVRAATLRAEADFLARVGDLLRRNQNVDVAREEQYLGLTREFHLLMASASSNQVLDIFNQGLMAMFVGRIDDNAFTADQRLAVLREHDAVLRAVLEGDADTAERLMREHMDHFLQGIAQRQPREYRAVIRWG